MTTIMNQYNLHTTKMVHLLTNCPTVYLQLTQISHIQSIMPLYTCLIVTTWYSGRNIGSKLVPKDQINVVLFFSLQLYIALEDSI